MIPPFKEAKLLPQARVMVAPNEGTMVLEGGFGVVLKLAGAETGDSFSVVEHPLAPGVLGSPPHTHTNEDEYSFVVEGKIGVMVGEEVYEAGPGSYVIKPRGVPHAFWNSGPEPARIVEIISPAGFERYFEELAEALSTGGPPEVSRLEEIAARYGLTFHWERMGEIMERYGVGLG